jgi:hypothetical protein
MIALPSRETVAVFFRWTGAALRGVSFWVFMGYIRPNFYLILFVPVFFPESIVFREVFVKFLLSLSLNFPEENPHQMLLGNGEK